VTTIIGLFNLKVGATHDEYERWARGADLASATLQRVAAEYRQFADTPLFILTEAL